jgi:hypothetical protein
MGQRSRLLQIAYRTTPTISILASVALGCTANHSRANGTCQRRRKDNARKIVATMPSKAQNRHVLNREGHASCEPDEKC